MSLQAKSRRSFFGQAGLMTAAATVWDSASQADERDDQRPVVVGVMGASRGSALAEVFGRLPAVEVRYVCDVDQNRVKALQESLSAKLEKPVQATGDFRQILDDPAVDALICAAPNHWHAPAGILACAAGKHAYVEKPCSHNPQEG
ncbi:MAG: Gfo/Idh/MocA family protein, partial [Planctomycetaceae bacterium]